MNMKRNESKTFNVFVIGMMVLLLAAFNVSILQASDGTGDKPVTLKLPEPGNIQILKLKNGSYFIGKIEEIGEKEIKMRGNIGVLTLEINEIASIEEVPASSFKKGQYWFPHPNATRLYFFPTGRMLKKGEGYFVDIYGILPGFSYGIFDKITVGGGMSIVPSVRIEDQVYYFTPKVGIISEEKFNFAVGALFISTNLFEDDDDNFISTSLYGVGTFGTEDKSLSIGVGFGVAGEEMITKPLIMVGGDFRLSRRLSFVTENWLIPGMDPIISYGLRFMGKKMSIDLGFVNSLNRPIFPGIPYVDFVFKL